MVIFGGRSEIGVELAQLLAPGATVILAARTPERLSAQVAAVEQAGAAKVDVRQFDADDLTSHAALVAALVADHGPIGTAVLAFGILGDQARAEEDPAHTSAVLHTDFVAQANLLTVLTKTMRSAGSGSIVVFSSVAGVRVRRANYVYGSAKAGLDGFCSGLADALHGSGVRLLLVRPGFVVGRMTEGMDPAPMSSTPQQVAAATARALRKVVALCGSRGRCGRSSSVCDCYRNGCGAGCRDERSREERRVPMIVVVGIGADGLAGLAPSARAELARATVVYGSARQLELLDDTVSARRRPWPSPMLPALRTLLEDAEGDVHVVASGDPLMHGVGGTLIRLYGPDKVAVLPHVSSVTLACSRVGWTVQDTEIISLVTAEPHTAVRRGGRAVVMSRDATTPAALARLLTETGRGDSEITVLEQLGGPAERRRSATAREWAARPPGDVDALNVVAVRYLPDERRLSVLPDDSFAHDGQITKQSMRAVTLAALAPRPGELLWDVGAGSGSIAIEWCRNGAGCHAIAFERDEQRRKRIVDNVTTFGVRVDVRSEAPTAFDTVAPPAAIFVGGGLTEPGLFDACYERLGAGGRLVANAVTAESEAVLTEWHSRVGGGLRRFQHYIGEPLGKFTGWRPAMPVTQWVVTKE